MHSNCNKYRHLKPHKLNSLCYLSHHLSQLKVHLGVKNLGTTIWCNNFRLTFWTCKYSAMPSWPINFFLVDNSVIESICMGMNGKRSCQQNPVMIWHKASISWHPVFSFKTFNNRWDYRYFQNEAEMTFIVLDLID